MQLSLLQLRLFAAQTVPGGAKMVVTGATALVVSVCAHRWRVSIVSYYRINFFESVYKRMY